MARSRFGLFALASLCLAAIAALPGRALGFVRDVFDTVVLATNPTAVADLFRSNDSGTVFAGPAGSSIDPALANDQRHEAGLSRLGSVRHT